MQQFFRRNTCILCGEKLTKKIMDYNGLPSSAQDLLTEDEIELDKPVDLHLCECSNCGLVQFDCSPVSYYKDVIRSGGYSSTLAKIRREEYQDLIDNYGLKDKRIIEIGCGAGEFLSILKEFPVISFGIEHKPDLVKAAQEKGLNVWQDFTESDNHSLLKNPGDELYDGFLSFNFIEHQPEPKTMMNCINHNLKEGGIGLITVPGLEYMTQYGSYYEFMRDHIAYYSFKSIRKLMNACGFSVIKEEILNHDTVSIIVKKTSDKIENVESQFDDVLDFGRLKQSVVTLNEQVDNLISQLKKDNKTLAIWGASHQCFTLASTTKLGEYSSIIIDSAVFKQNKYAPVFHKLIVSPDQFLNQPTDAIIIIAPGFYNEIANIIRSKFINDNGLTIDIYALFDDKILKL